MIDPNVRGDVPRMIKIHADKRWMGQWGLGGESMWATPTGAGRARVESVPFFTQGIAYKDVVAVDKDGEILSVVEPSDLIPMVVLVKDPDEGNERLKRVDEAVRALFPDIHAEGGMGTVYALNPTKGEYLPLCTLLNLMKKRKLIVGYEVTR